MHAGFFQSVRRGGGGGLGQRLEFYILHPGRNGCGSKLNYFGLLFLDPHPNDEVRSKKIE